MSAPARASDPDAVAGGSFHRHGGRLAEAQAAYPLAPTPWLDLSTGINPSPWRGRRAGLADLRRLPEPQDLAALEAAAARAFGAEAACVAAVPGAEAGLRLAPALTGAASVAIAGPTYGGHAEAWAGRTACPLIAAEGAEARVVVNPNNPDGATWTQQQLVDLAAKGWLIVDESFVEAAPQLSVAPLVGTAGFERLIVLRSFGKFYGLPGVRLGFVVAAPAVAAQARAAFGDWPVAADAIAMGTAAYADPAWRARTLRRLQADALRLDHLLTKAGFEVVGGTALFRLAAAPDAGARFERLAAQGVLTRPFADQPSWLRFGLPATAQWDRLAAALQARA